jgi:hypothetical protein
MSQGVEEKHPARQGEGDGKQHMRHLNKRVVGDIEEEVDDEERDGQHALESTLGAHFILVLPTPLDVGALRELDALGHRPSGFLEKAPDVAAADV